MLVKQTAKSIHPTSHIYSIEKYTNRHTFTYWYTCETSWFSWQLFDTRRGAWQRAKQKILQVFRGSPGKRGRSRFRLRQGISRPLSNKSYPSRNSECLPFFSLYFLFCRPFLCVLFIRSFCFYLAVPSIGETVTKFPRSYFFLFQGKIRFYEISLKMCHIILNKYNFTSEISGSFCV